MKNPSIQ